MVGILWQSTAIGSMQYLGPSSSLNVLQTREPENLGPMGDFPIQRIALFLPWRQYPYEKSIVELDVCWLVFHRIRAVRLPAPPSPSPDAGTDWLGRVSDRSCRPRCVRRAPPQSVPLGSVWLWRVLCKARHNIPSFCSFLPVSSPPRFPCQNQRTPSPVHSFSVPLGDLSPSGL
jgi:hypothetical protein